MIVRYTIQQPTLLSALREAPSTRIVWEQTDRTDNGEQLLLIWAESDDFDAFEAAMHDDPTVTAPRCLIGVSDRRLYQVEQVGEGRAQSVYPAMVEAGGIIQKCSATHEGWEVQAMLSDNDALTHFYDKCADHNLQFDLLAKYEQSTDQSETHDYGLTDDQREMLLRAVEQGYYEVPRATDLEAVAAELGISHQAGSERLRRAIARLVDHTIARKTPHTKTDRPIKS